MFDPLPSLYWHTLKDNSFVECFKSNEVNINTKKAEVSTGTKNWKIILKLSNLEELILYHPTREQVEAVMYLPKLKRLHIIKVQLKNFDFLSDLENLEHFTVWLIPCKAEFPIFLSALKLKKLKHVM